MKADLDHFEMIAIPGGIFGMGSTDDEAKRCVAFWASKLLEESFTKRKFHQWIHKECPVHSVRIEPYRISKYPITNAQYRLFCLATNAPFPESLQENSIDNHPVWGIDYREALDFSNWFSSMMGESFRLPTEAEWEFAARGPQHLEYPYGNAFDPTKANTFESGIGTTTPVDFFDRYASPFGICDMAGNVEEWTTDFYAPYPGGDWIDDDLTHTLGKQYRILRGGSFARGGDLSRCARRHGPYQGKEYRYVGFRLVAKN